MLDALVQVEPAGQLDTELAGQFAAIGIVKGEKFEPDARMRAILEEAVAVGNATSRTLGSSHPTEGFALLRRARHGGTCCGSAASTSRRRRRRSPRTASSRSRHRGAKAALAYRVLLLRHGHHASDVHAADRRRVAVPCANVDANGEPLRRCQDLPGEAATDIPAARFWSFTVYDNQTRSMLQTPQRYPRAGSQSYPSPAAETERGRVHRRLLLADPARRHCGGKLDPDRPGQGLVRHPAPLQPAGSRSSTRRGDRARSSPLQGRRRSATAARHEQRTRRGR